eukprot:TRINITY_DN5294_c0_g1_i6.p1 TRINITY_DN5294_c0_g1~~TRINITY_DN5294_c0_g1_i6.p1  ORF type:complete len:1404 (+),score=405.48 TRINITY_DN5294_c0_g1_i6:901-5112(+)
MELEQEKVEQRRFFQQQALANTASMNMERAEYVKKIEDLQVYNKNIVEQLQKEQSERELWQQEVQAEFHLKLQEMKFDLELERENNRDLTRRLNEERRNELLPHQNLQEQVRKLQFKKQNLEELVQDLKKTGEKDKRELTDQLEEALASLDRLRQSNEFLKAEKNSIEAELKSKTRGDVAIESQRKISKLESTNKRLITEAQEWKVEKENLLVAEQKAKTSAAEAEHKIFAQVVELQTEKTNDKREINKLQQQLWNSEQEVRGLKEETKRLGNLSVFLSEAKGRVSQLEKEVHQQQQDNRKEKQDLTQQLKQATILASSLKENLTVTFNDLEELKGVLKRSVERERFLEDERRRLTLELEVIKDKMNAAEDSKRQARESLISTETNMQLEINQLKQEMKEKLTKAGQTTVDIEYRYKADLRDQKQGFELTLSRLNLEQQRLLKEAQQETDKWRNIAGKTQQELISVRSNLLKLRQDLEDFKHQTSENNARLQEEEASRSKEIHSLLKNEKMKVFEYGQNEKLWAIEKSRFNKIIESATEKINKHDEEVAILKKEIDEFKMKEREYRAELEAQRERVAILRKEHQALTTQSQTLDKENTELMAIKQKLLGERDHLQTNLGSAIKMNEELKDKLKKEENQGLSDINQAETKASHLQRELDALKLKLEVTLDEKQNLLSTKAEAEKVSKRLKEDFEEARQQYNGLCNEVLELKNSLLKSKGETEKRVSEATTTVRADLQKLIDSRDQRLHEATLKCEKLHDEVVYRDAEINALKQSKTTEMSSLNNQIQTLRMTITKLERDVQGKREEGKFLPSDFEQARLIAEEKTKELLEKELECDNLKEKLELISMDSESTHRSESNLKIKLEELEMKMEVQKKNMVGEIASLKKQLEEMKSTKEKLEARLEPEGKGKLASCPVDTQDTSSKMQELTKLNETLTLEVSELRQQLDELKQVPVSTIHSSVFPEDNLTADFERSKEERQQEVELMKKEMRSVAKKADEWQTKYKKLQEEKQRLFLSKRNLEVKLATVKSSRSRSLSTHPRGVEKVFEGTLFEDPVEGVAIRLQSLMRGRKVRKEYALHKKRYHTVQEVHTTECTYVESLQSLLDYFVKPLSMLGWTTPEEIQSIFGNVQEVYESNSRLLSEINDAVGNWTVFSTIGNVFVRNIGNLSPHVTYVENFMESSAALQRCLDRDEKDGQNLAAFLKIVRCMPSIQGHSLADLLILPVQRVPRYRLFLDDLIRRTPKSHPDMASLVEANSLVAKLALAINENNRRISAVKEWEKEQPYLTGVGTLKYNPNRGLLESLHSTTVCKKGKVTKENVFLLTDYILFGKDQKKLVRGFSSNSKVYNKITETITLTPDLAEMVTTLDEFDFPGSGVLQFVLKIENIYVHVGQEEVLLRWARLIKLL